MSFWRKLLGLGDGVFGDTAEEMERAMRLHGMVGEATVPHRCPSCGIVHRALDPGGRSCPLYCAACAGRPVQAHSREWAEKAAAVRGKVLAMRPRRRLP